MKRCVSLKKESINTLICYHLDANEAIKLMEGKIKHLETQVESERAVTRALQGAIKDMNGIKMIPSKPSVPAFQPASVLKVPKIDPNDETPRDKFGRPV